MGGTGGELRPSDSSEVVNITEERSRVSVALRRSAARSSRSRGSEQTSILFLTSCLNCDYLLSVLLLDFRLREPGTTSHHVNQMKSNMKTSRQPGASEALRLFTPRDNLPGSLRRSSQRLEQVSKRDENSQRSGKKRDADEREEH
ncbi:hypothetical protein EYF80_018298 [Liparis tanakae]|uniref:Uncharacterized protein n=1 Tax=Liparis tanakae TaxID=230148 RepID=A0A4Z2I2D2_9TELE|nr:hypothetical protein EYF80_018298 [Liparis tanakae]